MPVRGKDELGENAKEGEEDELEKYVKDEYIRMLRKDEFAKSLDNTEAMKYAGYADKAGMYDVTGGLCENNDKFAVDRPLYDIFKEGENKEYTVRVGDYVLILARSKWKIYLYL